MKFTGEELAGLLVAVSFGAGLNVDATVATLGLLAPVRGLCGRVLVGGVEIQLLRPAAGNPGLSIPK